MYNIEVEGDHCYRVGEQGLLVHNSSALPCECNDQYTNGPARPLKSKLDPEVKEKREHYFEKLRSLRVKMSLPKAGTAGDNYTLAILVIVNREILGVNRSIQSPKIPITIKVNNQSKDHAEAHAVQQAVNEGRFGVTRVARMYEDREPCPQCGHKGNQLRPMAKELGVECLIVHVPGKEPMAFTPSK